jgi:Glycosyl hydrolases family 15
MLGTPLDGARQSRGDAAGRGGTSPHSKVLAWVAIDRAVQAVEQWGTMRRRMHNEICQRAVDPRRGCFIRAYGSTELDASLLPGVCISELGGVDRAARAVRPP